MKKEILMFAFVLFSVFAFAGQPTNAEILEGIDAIGQSQLYLADHIHTLEQKIIRTDAILDSLTSDVTVIKTPVETQEQANLLFSILAGFLNFIVVGVLLKVKAFKEFNEQYASKGVLTILTTVIFSVVIFITTPGMTVLKLAQYLMGILATHFGVFTATKPVAKPVTETT